MVHNGMQWNMHARTPDTQSECDFTQSQKRHKHEEERRGNELVNKECMPDRGSQEGIAGFNDVAFRPPSSPVHAWDESKRENTNLRLRIKENENVSLVPLFRLLCLQLL